MLPLNAAGCFPRDSSPWPFHSFPLLKIFQDSSKRGEATALNTFQEGNRREFTSDFPSTMEARLLQTEAPRVAG